jgi:hypothetical protein
MKRIVLIFGSIAGVIVGGMFVVTWPLHENGTLTPEYGMLVGYTTMIIALSLIFFGVKSYRDNHLNGAIRFGKAFGVGLCIALVASVIYALTWEVMYNTVASDYLQEWNTYTLQKMKDAGASVEELAKQQKESEEFAETYKNPIVRFGMTLMEIAPVGLLISLISAALLRKKEFLKTQSDNLN